MARSRSIQLKFSELTRLSSIVKEYAQLQDYYLYLHMVPMEQPDVSITDPLSLAGFTVCLVESGQLSGKLNDTPFSLEPRTLFTFPPNATVEFNHNGNPELNYRLLFFSPKFLHDLNLDLNVINLHDLVQNSPRPTVVLTEEEFDLLGQYMDLMARNAHQNTELQFAKSIGRSLAQALIYQLLQCHTDHRPKPEKGSRQSQTRQVAYLQDFMHMVQVHHAQHRTVNFYAEKLFISPKYLSSLVKEGTGRSASEWISNFVIQTAKNMLRFSNKNVQQVAFALNFPSQSSFGKYFKHLTGLSPSEYQKS